MEEITPEPIRVATGVAVQMAFACENISTDPAGRLSFQNVIDQLNAVTFPAATPSFFAIFSFMRSTPGFLMQCRVEIVPPVGDPIVSQALQEMAFHSDSLIARAICGLPGIMWPTPGEYIIRFTSMGSPIVAFPLKVNQIQLPGQSGR